MQKTAVLILTIHDRREACLAVDLKDVLNALGRHLARWVWCITDLDCLGGSSGAVSQQVKAARGSGVWTASEDLVNLAGEIYQTIDGDFVAFPRDIDRQSIDPRELDVSEFPNSRAELAIRAVDSSFFEVYTREPEIADLLRQKFMEVHDEKPSMYFHGINCP